MMGGWGGGGVGTACQWFLISAAASRLMLTYIQNKRDNKNDRPLDPSLPAPRLFNIGFLFFYPFNRRKQMRKLCKIIFPCDLFRCAEASRSVFSVVVRVGTPSGIQGDGEGEVHR